MFMTMKLFLSVILALPFIVRAEEELISTKDKRSLNNYHTGLHSLTLDDLHKSDLFDNDFQWKTSLDPIFNGYSSFFANSFPTNFAEGIFSPGFTLMHNLHQPSAARFAPPVSVPQVVTAQPPPAVNVPGVPRPPATTYGIPQSPNAPISPPAPTPISRPQVGRLGSGSLGYVHLGNGLYALGSGSLGYTPPAQPAPPVQPPQPNYAGAVGYTPPVQVPPPTFALNSNPPISQPNQAPPLAFALNSNSAYTPPAQFQPLQAPPRALSFNYGSGYISSAPPVNGPPPYGNYL